MKKLKPSAYLSLILVGIGFGALYLLSAISLGDLLIYSMDTNYPKWMNSFFTGYVQNVRHIKPGEYVGDISPLNYVLSYCTDTSLDSSWSLDLLLKSGADVNAPAQGEATRGKTSLAFAHELTKASNPVRLNEMITILKDHGAHE